MITSLKTKKKLRIKNKKISRLLRELKLLETVNNNSQSFVSKQAVMSFSGSLKYDALTRLLASAKTEN
jgi:hypothetical protein